MSLGATPSSRFYIWVLGLALSTSALSAGNAGTTAFLFLSMPKDAEPAALGYTAVASLSSPASTIHNPAGLGFVESLQLRASHLEWIGGLRNESFSAAIPLGPGTFGIMGEFMSFIFYQLSPHSSPTPDFLKIDFTCHI